MERKARQFADPVEGYSLARLKELCRLITTIQTDQDDTHRIVMRTHVLRLLTVRWSLRAKLQTLRD